MIAFARAVQNPQKYVKYTPKNDLAKAYKARWINTIQLFVPGKIVKTLFLDGYMKSTLLKDTPVVATEWGTQSHNGQAAVLTESLNELKAAREAYPDFWGVSIFEYSKAYNKDGAERTFGLLSYGAGIIGKTKGMYAVNADGSTQW